MLKANLILDGKIKLLKMKNEIEEIIEVMETMNNAAKLLMEQLDKLEADFTALQDDFIAARAENHIKALQIESLRNENANLKKQIK